MEFHFLEFIFREDAIGASEYEMAIWKDVLIARIKYSILVAVFVYACAAIKKTLVFCSDSVHVFIGNIFKPMTYFLCYIIE